MRIVVPLGAQTKLHSSKNLSYQLWAYCRPPGRSNEFTCHLNCRMLCAPTVQLKLLKIIWPVQTTICTHSCTHTPQQYYHSRTWYGPPCQSLRSSRAVLNSRPLHICGCRWSRSYACRQPRSQTPSLGSQPCVVTWYEKGKPVACLALKFHSWDLYPTMTWDKKGKPVAC